MQQIILIKEIKQLEDSLQKSYTMLQDSYTMLPLLVFVVLCATVLAQEGPLVHTSYGTLRGAFGTINGIKLIYFKVGLICIIVSSNPLFYLLHVIG